MTMPRYLIVANQTLGGEQLSAKMDELTRGGDATFHLVVPVTQTEGFRQWDYPPIDRAIPDAATIARSLAEGRLELELARLRRAAVEATGEVVEADPVKDIGKLLRAEHFDGIVVSTLPRRLSRWMIMDLPHRVFRLSDVPVTHVEGAAGPSL
jgi:hypothetical protein